MKKRKKTIMLDITPLQYGYIANTARSGIFFTVKNVMLQLLKRDDIELYFHLNPADAPNIDISVSSVLQWEFPEYKALIDSRTFSAPPSGLLLFCNRRDLEIARAKERFRDNRLIFFLLRVCYCLVNRVLRPLAAYCPVLKLRDVIYLSLMLDPPDYIKTQIPACRRYLMLYDTIPLSIPEYAGDLSGWFGAVARNISPDCNYMAISASTRNDFVHFFPALQGKDIPVVPLAAASYFHPVTDPERRAAVMAKYHIPQGKKIFYSHCSLAPHKNLDMLFRAFIEFHRTDSEWVMVFSGANMGEKIEQLRRLASESALPESFFVFTGYVEDDELPVLYSLADVFCFVSRYEGFGLPVLEAMQCGCPCVVSSSTSLPEVAGDAALMVDPADLEDIVRGMTTLARDPALRAELSRRSLARAKEFSWEKVTKMIVESIKERDER